MLPNVVLQLTACLLRARRCRALAAVNFVKGEMRDDREPL
jgi:hypothetical protein